MASSTAECEVALGCNLESITETRFSTPAPTSSSRAIVEVDHFLLPATMSSHIGVPHIDHLHRPNLTRSRSRSTPSQHASTPEEAHSAAERDRQQRPAHARSQSHLPSVDPAPRSASTLPTPPTTLEKASSKLHLPGKHHLHHDSSRRHRYTAGETEQHHRLGKRQTDTDSLPNLVAGLNAERERRAAALHSGEKEKHGPNDVLSVRPGSLTRMMTSRSYRGGQALFGPGDGSYSDTGGGYDLRRRATSDPRQPTRHPQQQRSINPIEQDLARADRMRHQRRFTLTPADVARKDAALADAEDEMSAQIAEINRAGMETARRLDYGYYTLLEKVGSLVGTIQSFHRLAQQSQQLVANFERETEHLDADMRRRVRVFKQSFENRETRVGLLEARGKNVGRKAEELGSRLENARVVLENWEKKEDKAKKVWGRFWVLVWWSLTSVLLAIAALVLWKEWWFRGDPVKAGLNVPSGGSWNRSLSLGDDGAGGEGGGGGVGEEMLRQAEHLPDDVRAVLRGIEERNRQGKGQGFVAPAVPIAQVTTDDATIRPDEGDDTLRVLDEL